MKLSIIVCAYNAEKTLVIPLESLLRQSVPIKIIIVDDGSKDETKRLAESYVIRYPDQISYHYKKNGGIASAREFGLSFVDTEYFGYLDADDEVKEDMAEKMLEIATKEDSDIVIADFIWRYSDKDVYQDDTHHKDKRELLTDGFATIWNKIYKTSFIRSLDLHFKEGLDFEDTCFSLRLFPNLNKISYIHEAFVYYMQRDDSITHVYGGSVADMLKVFEVIHAYYESQGLLDTYHTELEYLTTRYFLGSSYLRAIRIKDKALRKKVLDSSWDYLNRMYPDFKDNIYLKRKGLKNIYYRHISKPLYDLAVHLFRLAYSLKVMR